MNETWKWLLLEGCLPLLGASCLYLLLGLASFIVAEDKTTFDYRWSEAIDSLAWLYGGDLISIRAGITALDNSKDFGNLPFYNFACAFGCTLILLAAMMERGSKQAWKPPGSLVFVAIVLLLIVFLTAFQTQAINLAP